MQLANCPTTVTNLMNSCYCLKNDKKCPSLHIYIYKDHVLHNGLEFCGSTPLPIRNSAASPASKRNCLNQLIAHA